MKGKDFVGFRQQIKAGFIGILEIPVGSHEYPPTRLQLQTGLGTVSSAVTLRFRKNDQAGYFLEEVTAGDGWDKVLCITIPSAISGKKV